MLESSGVSNWKFRVWGLGFRACLLACLRACSFACLDLTFMQTWFLKDHPAFLLDLYMFSNAHEVLWSLFSIPFGIFCNVKIKVYGLRFRFLECPRPLLCYRTLPSHNTTQPTQQSTTQHNTSSPVKTTHHKTRQYNTARTTQNNHHNKSKHNTSGPTFIANKSTKHSTTFHNATHFITTHHNTFHKNRTQLHYTYNPTQHSRLPTTISACCLFSLCQRSPLNHKQVVLVVNLTHISFWFLSLHMLTNDLSWKRHDVGPE